MKRRVVFHPAAQKDVDQIYDWIADQAGEETARRYTGRVRDYCAGMDLFPERGSRRDDLRPSLRLVGFERRITIAFSVTDETVVILRLLYGGRDVEGALGGKTG